MNIVLIGLTDQLPEHDTNHKLHRLLSALFSKELSVDEKLAIIGSEYDIPTQGTINEGVNVICNLSQGIREAGRTEGRAQGRAEGRTEGRAEREARIILTMHKKGYTLEQIADVVEKDPRVVRDILVRGEQE